MPQNIADLPANNRPHRTWLPAGPVGSVGGGVHVSGLCQMFPKRESDQRPCIELKGEGEPDRQELARAGEGPLPEGLVEIRGIQSKIDKPIE